MIEKKKEEKEMFDSLVINAKVRAMKLAERFMTEEKGDVNIVSIVVIIGIVIILAGIFKNQLIGLINNLFGKIAAGAEGVVDITT